MVVFGVGSRYESEAEAGISHVLEHMHYKGTKKRPTPLELAEFVENIGGEHNAFTGKEYTGYYVKVAAKFINQSLDFLSDILTGSTFDSEELEKEKQVIISELDMYEDLPMEVAASRFELCLFGSNSLGRDVIGYKKSIRSVTRDSLIKYRDRFYSAKNCVVVIAGNFGAESESSLAKNIESSFAFSPAITEKYQDIDYDFSARRVVTKKKTEQSHFIVGFPGVAKSDPDRYTLSMLALILGGSMSSRMFTEIREKRGLAYSVRTSSENYLDTGAFETYAGVDNSRASEAIAAVITEYEKARDGVSASELQRAKEYIYGRVLISLEDSSEAANMYAISEILTGEIISPEEAISRYQAVSLDDVKRVAQKYIDQSKMVISFVGEAVDEKTIQRLGRKQ